MCICDPAGEIEHICTKYTPLHYSTYLTFCVSYTSSVS